MPGRRGEAKKNAEATVSRLRVSVWLLPVKVSLSTSVRHDRHLVRDGGGRDRRPVPLLGSG